MVSGMVGQAARAAHTIASAIPVLPLVGSGMMVSGPKQTGLFGGVDQRHPMRSLTLPAGLNDSNHHLAPARRSRRSRTNGVDPVSSVMSLAILVICPPFAFRLAAAHRAVRRCRTRTVARPRRFHRRCAGPPPGRCRSRRRCCRRRTRDGRSSRPIRRRIGCAQWCPARTAMPSALSALPTSMGSCPASTKDNTLALWSAVPTMRTPGMAARRGGVLEQGVLVGRDPFDAHLSTYNAALRRGHRIGDIAGARLELVRQTLIDPRARWSRRRSCCRRPARRRLG